MSFALSKHNFTVGPDIYVIEETATNGTRSCVLGMEVRFARRQPKACSAPHRPVFAMPTLRSLLNHLRA